MFAAAEARVLRRWSSGLDELVSWTDRRVAGEPLEHIVGRVEFGGLDLRVGPGVFVPRQRSMLLVETVDGLLRDRRGALVEACCGAAPIASVIRARRPSRPIIVSDIDDAALRYARVNVPDAAVCRGDLLDGVPDADRGAIAVIAAVPPYVPDGHAAFLPVDAVDHEPRRALFAGPDGLAVIRRLLDQAVHVLADGGAVAVELHRDQADDAVGFADAVGCRSRVVSGDDGQTAVLVSVAARPG